MGKTVCFNAPLPQYFNFYAGATLLTIMFVEALQYRRNSKTESALRLESQRSEPRPDSTDFLHISGSDAQGVPALPTYGSQQHSPGSEPIGPTPPGSNNRGTHQGQGDEQEDHNVRTASQGDISRNAREAQIVNVYKRLDDFSALRVHARQSRMALSYKREDEMKLRVELMKRLNAFFANLDHPEAEPIMQEYELLQTTAEEYVKLENSYREEEDNLEEQEYILKMSMEDFAGSFNNGDAPNFQNDTRFSSPGTEEESTDETPSHVITYLTGIAQERMLQEQLSELESEWYMANEKQVQRQRLDMPLDQESADFLQTFEEEHNNTWKDLNNIQMDVDAFRMICLEQDHKGFAYQDLSSLHSYHPYMGGQIWEPEPNPLKLPPQDLAVFPEETGALSLGNNEYLEIESGIPEITPRSQHQFNQALQQKSSISSNEYMNKWMLHQLRISSVGIWRLTRSPLWQPLREQGWQEKDIGQAVLDTWFSDETALAPSSYNPYLNNNDDGEDTVVGRETGRKPDVVMRAQSLPSPPSSPRASSPKVGSMRPRSSP